MLILGMVQLLGGCDCTPSYVTGDRTSSITTSQSGVTSDAISNLVDGAFGSNGTDAISFTGAVSVTNDYIQYQFAAAVKITEAKWYASGTSTNGTWKWQGSNNGSDWTDLSSNFTLTDSTGGSGSVIGDLSGNTNGYTYYRMLGVSGTYDGGDWHQEIEFKQCTC